MEQNRLFPVFLKLEELHTVLVGGGNVGLEKLTALLKSSPDARITIVAPLISEAVRELAASHPRVRLVPRKFRRTDLVGADIVMLATDDPALHARIRKETRKRGILINVADTPDLCDFYLGSVVTKGNLRIGISTNGKSPTIARRIREFFEEALPDEADALLTNMNRIRERIAGDFKEKVKTLSEITASWLEKK
ncbi:MAG: bifunctional precorrin-2 dehydrogenase/sirohydrochlorin ferrochelatase [Cyclobacteriaceae bacterium]|jgi:precorrin-2 dehydrogenase/sirohydrochlorin ferrochelatase|nr:bifunctional precorrin-2 dehydrogenase/sirohydrochlorin ferrochelatase [Cyclobacteriaceae bacterium]